jgi:uncharacterized protein YbaP (TraB family)
MRARLARKAALGCMLGLLLAGCATPPRPLLWRISGGDRSVYLLGSLHFLKDGDYPLSSDVEAAYRHVERLVFEVSPAEMTSPATAALVSEHGTYPDAKHTLKDDLSPAVWQQVLAYGAKNDLPEADLQRYRPWMVSMRMSVLECQKIGLTSDAGLDQHFMRLAETDHKTTSGLETFDQQLAISYNLPVRDQVQMLKESLDGLADLQKGIQNEHDIWRRGDGETLAAQAKSGMATYPDFYQKLIVQRNRNWVPLIEGMLRDHGRDALVIVGAVHLEGPDGVVSLLQHDGYTVERICTGCASVH